MIVSVRFANCNNYSPEIIDITYTTRELKQTTWKNVASSCVQEVNTQNLTLLFSVLAGFPFISFSSYMI
jgi:hypothetical protein